MIVLDTNVAAELMRPKPHPCVPAWVANLPRQLLHTTHISQAELLYGIAVPWEGLRPDVDRSLGGFVKPGHQSW